MPKRVTPAGQAIGHEAMPRQQRDTGATRPLRVGIPEGPAPPRSDTRCRSARSTGPKKPPRSASHA